MSLFSVFLYGVGVRQQFMYTTQIMLLRISALSALILGIVSIYGIVLDIWFLVRTRGLHFLLGIMIYFAAAVFGTLIAATAIFILILAGGNIE